MDDITAVIGVQLQSAAGLHKYFAIRQEVKSLNISVSFMNDGKIE